MSQILRDPSFFPQSVIDHEQIDATDFNVIDKMLSDIYNGEHFRLRNK